MKRNLLSIVLFVSVITITAQEGFIGEVRMFAGNFAPRNWAFCEGQLLAISQNQALFSILGTTYGGDGRTTFALPDLRGRVAIHPGTGPGLSNYRQGQTGGVETVTLGVINLPPHSHAVSVNNPVNDDEATSDDPTAKYPAVSGENMYSETTNAQGAGPNVEVANTGSGVAVENRQPYATVNYIICLQGVFPSRN